MNPADNEKDKLFVMETDSGEVEVSLAEVKELASKGDSAGMFALGMAYVFGHAVEMDKEKGYDLLEKSAAQGNPDAKILRIFPVLQKDPYFFQCLFIKAFAGICNEYFRHTALDGHIYKEK